jgi:hypothetical protein
MEKYQYVNAAAMISEILYHYYFGEEKENEK